MKRMLVEKIKHARRRPERWVFTVAEQLEARLLLFGPSPGVASITIPVLSVAAATSDEVDLQWSLSPDFIATKVTIERSLSEAPFAQIASLPLSATSYADGTTGPLSTVRYRLAETEVDGTLVYSNLVTATTLPNTLTNSVLQLPAGLTEASSNPSQPVVANGLAYFWAADGQGNTKLWRSDGTSDGTFDLAAAAPQTSTPDPVGVGGTVYFAYANQLWKTDGSVAGTSLVAVVAATDPSAEIQQLADLDGSLYFTLSTSTSNALWASDGTSVGTQLVSPLGTGGYGVGAMVVSGNRLFLNATTTAGSTPYTPRAELWVSNGTTTGTTVVTDPSTGDPRNIYELFDAGGKLFFVAPGGKSGQPAVWVSDGTSAGTVPVTDASNVDLNLDLYQFYAFYAAGVGQTLYFVGYSGQTETLHLWKSDGTTAGTGAVADLGEPFQSNMYEVPAHRLFASGGRVYFSTYDLGTQQTEVWTSDGANAGTTVLTHLTSTAGVGAYPFASVNGAVYFAASSGAHEWDLWKTDGTPGGTQVVRPFPWVSTSETGQPENLTAFGTLLLFSADDLAHGRELWKSDGTAAGTQMVRDIALTEVTVEPDQLTAGNGVVLFSATTADGHSAGLWVSDGTSSGSTMIYQGPVTGLYNTGSAIYFGAGASNASPLTLEKTDGTGAGTVAIASLSSIPADLVPLGAAVGSFFFGVWPENQQPQLWVTNGTASGTRQISGQHPLLDPLGGTKPPDYAVSNGDLFYITSGPGGNGYELWKTDGTDAGTVQLASFTPPPGGLRPGALTDVNGTLLFTADDGTNGPALWKSDGTAAGTVLVRPAFVNWILNVNGTGVFAAYDGVHTAELWKTDGTAAGTILVSDISPGTNTFIVAARGTFWAAGSQLYFETMAGNIATLWRSDGTTSGTVPLHRISGTVQAPGFRPAIVDGIWFFGDTSELWRTDGTATGTWPVYSYAPRDSSPDAAVRHRLYVVTHTSSGIDELQYASVAPLAAPTGMTATDLPPTPTSFLQVQLSWMDPSVDAAGFEIQRSIHSDFSTAQATQFVPAGQTTFTDQLPYTEAVYYRVRAVNADGASEWSNSASAAFAAISVFNDLNYNGRRDGTEPGLPGVTVQLVPDNNGQLGAPVYTATTDGSGNSLLGVVSGTYLVRQVVPPGYAATAPLGYSSVIDMTGGPVVGSVFGDVLISSVVMNFGYLITLARNYGQPGTFANGDLNGDGEVNFTDLTLLARNYGHALASWPATPAVQAQAEIASSLFAQTYLSSAGPAEHHRQRRTRLG